MNTRMQTEFDRLEADTKDLLTYLNKFEGASLNRSPRPEVFTALQNCEHLMKAEVGAVEYIKKKLSFDPKLKRANLRTKMRLPLLLFATKLPIKIKAPKGMEKEDLPDQSDFFELAKRWQRNRDDMAAYLRSLPEEHYDKELFKHPLAGKLTLAAMLRFHREHLARHRRQIKRTLKEMGY